MLQLVSHPVFFNLLPVSLVVIHEQLLIPLQLAVLPVQEISDFLPVEEISDADCAGSIVAFGYTCKELLVELTMKERLQRKINLELPIPVTRVSDMSGGSG